MWPYVWLFMAAWVTTTAHPDLSCTHPLCQRKNPTSWVYYVEGQKMVIGFIGEELIVECQGNESVGIDSPAMPRFSSAVSVPSFAVSFCPPPRKSSYAETLAAINVTLLQKKKQGNLRLHLASQPPLTARHFMGMEDIKSLVLESYRIEDRPAPAAGVLAPLRRLRQLEVFRVLLSADELNQLPASLLSLDLYLSGVTMKQKVLQTLANLRKLSLGDGSYVFTPPTVHNVQGKNILRTEMTSSLQIVSLAEWTETHPAELSLCDSLQEFKLYRPMMKELPERWVAACPHLNILSIDNARNLTSLPSKMLEGAHSLEKFFFENGIVETLPGGLFANLHRLQWIDLSNNRLHTLPSEIFMGLSTLKYLSLNNNDLRSNVQDSLTELYNVTEISMNNNTGLGDLCEPSGYSRLVNLKKLRLLDLSNTNITRTCDDWRTNLTKLENLILPETQIPSLTILL